MQNTLVFLSVLLGAGLCLAQDTKEPPKPQDATPKVEKLTIGTAIPADVHLTDTAGKAVRFGDLRGKVVMVHFWSTTCPWEKLAEPKLQAIADDYAKQDVVVLAINANQNEIGEKPEPAAFKADKDEDRPYAGLRAHAKKVKVDHPILLDHGGAVAALFGARTTPHCFVFDQKGVLRYHGALDSDGKKAAADKAYVRLAIDAILAGKDLETTTTEPYG